MKGTLKGGLPVAAGHMNCKRHLLDVCHRLKDRVLKLNGVPLRCSYPWWVHTFVNDKPLLHMREGVEAARATEPDGGRTATPQHSPHRQGLETDRRTLLHVSTILRT